MNSIKSKNHFLVKNYLKLFSLNQQMYSTFPNDIKIPNYIPRGKTDILKALASTIQQCPTNLQYGMMSDPRLAPKNIRDFKTFYLSKESGVKAAKYFMKNYPELFYRDQAEPKIESFSYPDVYNDKMQFDLDDIRSSIDKRNVSNAITAYKKLNDENIDIPLELRLSLFELVCFFNSQDAFDFVEELPFSRNFTTTFVQRTNIWNNRGYAEEMWSNFFKKEDNIIANSVYLQGLIKYGSFDKAYKTFMDFQNEKKKIDLDALNSIIKGLPFTNSLKLSVESIEKFLELINSNSYEPTIDTINSLLFVITYVKNDSCPRSELVKLVEKILLDCKLLNLKPTIGTYAHVLKIFYQENDAKDDIIYKIIDKLEKNKIGEAKSKDDFRFFYEAMKVANNLTDVNLSIKIFDLYKKNDNLYLNYFYEQDFYENFFITLCKGTTTDVIFDYYDRLCPGIFFPSPILFETLVDHLIVFNSFEYIERLFDELEKYFYYNLSNLSHKLFHLIVSVPKSEKIYKIFGDYMLKCLDVLATSQLKFTNQSVIDKNISHCNSILDHLIFLDKEKEVVKFILNDKFEDVQFVTKINSKNFFTKLLSKLETNNHRKEASDLLKNMISKGIFKLNDIMPEK